MAELKPKKQQKKIKQMIDTVMIGTAEALARAQRNGEIKDQPTEFMFIVYTAITLWQEVAKEQAISAWNKRSK
jgi:hypothetical protein